ncbi:MAG: hypothetical protein GTN80_03930 [Nitrososphaeria archaeon]|nr:hypothetical protein [Nitrososphaeria archaeon]NIN52300.1 hypothetical protein [Nitrososphaeria archaeon]NIQ32778.1 hypothetical protein [Nitrososphaeria archaeon]
MTEMTGKRLVLETLRSENVRYVFGNPGGTVTPLLDEMIDYSDIKYILALHENVASGMAYGYSKASGEPGVLFVHTTVGTANIVGNLFNAHRDDVPIVVIAGRRHLWEHIHEPTLSSDTVSIVDQFTKWNWRLTRIDEMPIALRRAFKIATDTPPGPVYLSIPMNIFDETIDAEIHPPVRHRISSRVRGDPDLIKKAAKLLIDAQNPVIIAGDGVSRSSATAELVKLAEMTSSRVYSEINTPSMNFPTDHPLYLGGGSLYSTGDIQSGLQSADVVLAVGCKIFRNYIPPTTQLFPMRVKFIHVNHDPREIAKNYSVDVGITADAKRGLEDLMGEIQSLIDGEKSRIIKQRFENVKKVKEELVTSRKKGTFAEWDHVPIKLSRLMKEMRKALRNDAVIVDESVTSWFHLIEHFDFPQPGTLIHNSGGYLGWGVGAALGAKLALPDRQVVLLIGDGGIMYEVQSLWTASRYNIPIVIVICNNGAYMATKTQLYFYDGKSRKSDKYVGVHLTESKLDFVKIAEGLGVHGERVEKPGEIAGALKRSLKRGEPVIIDVIVDPTDAFSRVLS